MDKGKLIAFLGPVGVGKSTIIKNLAETLRARGFRIHITFIKAFHGSSYLLWYIALRLVLKSKILKKRITHKELAPWYVLGRLHPPLAKNILTLSLFLDATTNIPLKLGLIAFYKKMGFTVLSEEYIYSTLLDYMYSYRKVINTNRLIRALLLLLTYYISRFHPDVAIYLVANISMLKNRWAKRGYGDPQLHYVLYQLGFYSVTFKLL